MFVNNVTPLVQNYLGAQAAKLGKDIEDFPYAKFVLLVLEAAKSEKDEDKRTKLIEFSIAALEAGSYADGTAVDYATWNTCWTKQALGRDLQIAWAKTLPLQ